MGEEEEEEEEGLRRGTENTMTTVQGSNSRHCNPTADVR